MNTINKSFENFLKEKEEELRARGFTVKKVKIIPFGVQYVAEKDGIEHPVNFYFSSKGRVSIVVGGKESSPHRSELAEILNAVVPAKRGAPPEVPWEKWIGTDESGKGDIFGPLVIAGFSCDRDADKALSSMNIADSKKVSTSRAIELAMELKEQYRDRIELVIFTPSRYNRIYEKFRREARGLNHLLAWGHALVLDALSAKSAAQGAIVDKFGRAGTVGKYMKKPDSIEIVELPRAEKYPAVAAASILARATFLDYIKAMEEHFSTTFPLGAGEEAQKAAIEFARKKGRQALSKVAKLHFAPLRKILQELSP